jgi:hypothetical protein
LLLDNNAIITLDLLPLSHISSSSSAGATGPTAMAAAAAAMKGAPASSLFGLLDRTASSAGKRKLRQWICRCVLLRRYFCAARLIREVGRQAGNKALWQGWCNDTANGCLGNGKVGVQAAGSSGDIITIDMDP